MHPGVCLGVRLEGIPPPSTRKNFTASKIITQPQLRLVFAFQFHPMNLCGCQKILTINASLGLSYKRANVYEYVRPLAPKSCERQKVRLICPLIPSHRKLGWREEWCRSASLKALSNLEFLRSQNLLQTSLHCGSF